MTVRILPDFLINQIAAGEVVERPASVVKELVENALDAGADEIVVDVTDGGRTRITVMDNGSGMSRDDLARSITRHATSKLPDDDLLNINFMGFRGEALPSIASVSDMTIDTRRADDDNGWQLDANTGSLRPSPWQAGTRIRVDNLFSRTPARLKFLRADRAEMMSALEVVKRLAMARPDVGFTFNNKWRFPKNQDMAARIADVMGDDVRGRMIEINAASASNSDLKIAGFISEPTLRRASGVDQYLFVNGRPVKDKVLVGALRAAYMDVMHAREFPLCALYLTMPSHTVDVNVSPAKTDVHFLEPSHVRAFIIKTLRAALARTLNDVAARDYTDKVQAIVAAPARANVTQPRFEMPVMDATAPRFDFGLRPTVTVPAPVMSRLCEPMEKIQFAPRPAPAEPDTDDQYPLGRVVGQIGVKYIIAQRRDAMIIIDQHAAHERIIYEKLRHNTIKSQPLLAPIVINLRAEDVVAVVSIADEMRGCGLHVDAFGDDAVAIFEKPADWDFDWTALLQQIADEVRAFGHSSQLHEKLHLKLANFACHHSVRAGQRLDMAQMTALLRQIEETNRGGECNHGRPVYKIIPLNEMDAWFERI